MTNYSGDCYEKFNATQECSGKSCYFCVYCRVSKNNLTPLGFQCFANPPAPIYCNSGKRVFMGFPYIDNSAKQACRLFKAVNDDEHRRRSEFLESWRHLKRSKEEV